MKKTKKKKTAKEKDGENQGEKKKKDKEKGKEKKERKEKKEKKDRKERKERRKGSKRSLARLEEKKEEGELKSKLTEGEDEDFVVPDFSKINDPVFTSFYGATFTPELFTFLSDHAIRPAPEVNYSQQQQNLLFSTLTFSFSFYFLNFFVILVSHGISLWELQCWFAVLIAQIPF